MAGGYTSGLAPPIPIFLPTPSLAHPPVRPPPSRAQELGCAAVEARVLGSHGYGFVSFTSHEEAQAVLEFAQQQGVWADEEHPLRVNWARERGAEAPAAAAEEHPRVVEARMQAQQLAQQADAEALRQLDHGAPPEREVVAYDDLF